LLPVASALHRRCDLALLEFGTWTGRASFVVIVTAGKP
jgi:hypothetical protein